MRRNSTLFLALAMLFSYSCKKDTAIPAPPPPPPPIIEEVKGYFLSQAGNDAGKGTASDPWRTIERLNQETLKPGDKIFFKSGETFTGTLKLDSSDRGSNIAPILISSYGNGKAQISSANGEGLRLLNSQNIRIEKLLFTGSGRKNGNTTPGVNILQSHNIELDSLDIEGYQKAGLFVNNSSYVRATNIFAHDNGFAGIYVSGEKDKQDCYQIYLGNCRAENNPGDPTELYDQSGNGILVVLCRRVTVEYCVATNNGWDMPRVGNGPVGIWACRADSVVIQHCISFRNKTSPGAEDGGGFDLDGGVTNSFVQYCLSYENYGAAFGLFQYEDAGEWSNNVFRYNISENDGLVSTAKAGAFIWNGTNDPKQFSRCYFYNNVIYNTKGAAINFADESALSEFYFCNNIFVAKDLLLVGPYNTSSFYGNDWWSTTTGFNVSGIKNFSQWANATQKETLNNQVAGYQIEPRFTNPGGATIQDANELNSFSNYKVLDNPAFLYNGVDLKALFNIDSGLNDFNQKPITGNAVGASF